ncbi:ATP-grasp domain-containing protein [Rubrivirga sp.]|uniref:ATP-grasp domain-containing protein n=1 Tax=Rubrivirga sp. TaxID=1885344 RepID=UPI003C76F04B
MPACTFLTMADLGHYVDYDRDAVAPLADRGWTVDFVPWRTNADWSAYDLVVIRTPWDYQNDPDAFFAVLQEIDAATRLENPLEVVRWNLHKTYLRDLEAAGVPIVPTTWGRDLDAATLAALEDEWGEAGGVVKPIVGACAEDAFRLGPDLDSAEAIATFADRDFMAQPFVQSVVTEGEFSVFVFGGAVSHAILKTPVAGDFRVQEEYGGRIVGVEPEPALVELAGAALEAVPHDQPLLYARVDAVRRGDGTFAIMELELIEPSLYFPFAEGSAARFADAIAGR